MDDINRLQVAVEAREVRQIRRHIFSNAEHYTDRVVKLRAVDGVGGSINRHQVVMKAGKARPTGRLINEFAADGEKGKGGQSPNERPREGADSLVINADLSRLLTDLCVMRPYLRVAKQCHLYNLICRPLRESQ